MIILEYLTGNYFAYCQFCRRDKNCELRHNEYLGLLLPGLTGICTGRIVFDSWIKKIICENCEAVLEILPEEWVCGKFNPASQTGELPLLRPDYKPVVSILKRG